jgi:hypothetical protein
MGSSEWLVLFQGGTRGSNPLCSTGESTANLTSSIRAVHLRVARPAFFPDRPRSVLARAIGRGSAATARHSIHFRSASYYIRRAQIVGEALSVRLQAGNRLEWLTSRPAPPSGSTASLSTGGTSFGGAVVLQSRSWVGVNPGRTNPRRQGGGAQPHPHRSNSPSHPRGVGTCTDFSQRIGDLNVADRLLPAIWPAAGYPSAGKLTRPGERRSRSAVGG